MSSYTERFEDYIYNMDVEMLRESIEEIVCEFRSFSDAIFDYFSEKYVLSSKNDIVELIFDKAKSNFVNLEKRNLKKWIIEDKPISKESAIKICFAMNLSLDESKDFLRRVCLCRGFDCHTINELVCYYCLKNGYDYSVVNNILSKVVYPQEININFSNEIFYTESIVNEVDKMTSDNEIINFINSNIKMFEYNNATAYNYVHTIWNEIFNKSNLSNFKFDSVYKDVNRKKNFLNFGLAYQDLALIICECSKSTVEIEEVYDFLYDKNLSQEDVILQILGYYEEELVVTGYKYENDLRGIRKKIFHSEALEYSIPNRSITNILKQNPMIHKHVYNCFPNREGLQAILRGEKKDDELVRKIIILLTFYKFWIVKAKKTKSYEAHQLKDGEHCLTIINNVLMECGYQEMYYGNPYDWIFIFAMMDDEPMNAFREFMKEVYYTYQESDEN